MPTLSKSKIIAYRQCPKRLWLEVNKPELREDSPSSQTKFRVGNQVGELARQIYDSRRTGATIASQRDGFPKAFVQTGELLAQADRPIFEAGFRIEGALAFADILLPVKKGRGQAWKMVEVKSSTVVKDYHKDDIAVQSHIAVASGVNVESVALACIDSKWVYPGDGDYSGLLRETDLTEETLARSSEVEGWIAAARKVADQRQEPKVATGDHCHTPFDCGFCNYCNRGTVKPTYPIDWLPKLGTKKLAELKKQGIDDLRHVPDAMLNQKQKRIKKHTLAGTVYFDRAGAKADLVRHGFPALFLDFETVTMAVPIWKGTRPYQQIPFQFSLHRLTALNEVSHVGFLDLSGHDPSQDFAQALIAACSKDGPIFVYHAQFEKQRIQELALQYPKLSKALLSLLPRVVDLLPIARKRYYHHAQHGSWSLKDVLPAAVPSLNYSSLSGVQNGGQAIEAFQEAISPTIKPARKEEIQRQLEAYCRLDTLAMLRLWHLFSGRIGAVPEDPQGVE